VVIGGHSVIVNRLEVSKNFRCFYFLFYNILYLMYNMVMNNKKDWKILQALQQQIEMENNLSYGDTFNFLGSYNDLYKGIDKEVKKD